MCVRYALYMILCLVLILGACTSEKTELENAEKGDAIEKVAETSETAKTHLGDCILTSPVPAPLVRKSSANPNRTLFPAVTGRYRGWHSRNAWP